MWLEIRNNLHAFKCKVTSLLCFAHFGMRMCGGAQLLSFFPSSESHKDPAQFVGEIDWSEVYFEG